MKKIFAIFVFSAIAILVFFSSCTNDKFKEQLNQNEISPEASIVYAPVLESWRIAIEEEFGYTKEQSEFKTYPFIRYALPAYCSQIHYAYYDIDGNGTPELLIASFYDFGYYFLADVYTIQDDNPVRLFDGVEDRGFWPRNRLDFSKNGNFLIISGSGGAAYTNTFFYQIMKNGYQVELVEGLTTYNPDDTNDLTPYHYLADGTYEIADDADKIMEKYYNTQYLDGSESPNYFSDFYTQIDWQPFVHAPEET